MQGDVLFCGSFSAQPSLIKRLANEFKEATREFRDNPGDYIAGAIKGDDIGGHRRKTLFRLGLAIALSLYAIFFVLALVLWTFNARRESVANKKLERIIIWSPIPNQHDPTMLKSEREGHGGGGGGNNESSPASQGAPPLFSSAPPIIAPTTRPTLIPPALPVVERLLGDPSQNIKRDEFIPTGLLDGVPGPPSDGPGSNGGTGSGNQGGVGPGKGPGYGPGENGGKNGGPYEPGGKTGSDTTSVADVKPIPLNEPRPNYTEEARKHKVQGLVRARVLIGSDGLIKQVKIIRGLPDGLNEEAIRAAMQMRFKPAVKNGQPIPYWTTLDVEFNLR